MADQDTINYEFFHWGPLVCRFETPIELGKKLTALGRKRKENDYRKELAGHLDHEYGFTQNDLEVFVKWYGKYFNSYAEAYSERFGTDYGGLELTSLWINFMQAGDFNPPHMHTQHISFVLYTSDTSGLDEEVEQFEGTGPAPGNIIFTYGENSYTYAPDWNIRNHHRHPKAGDLYIFPALLKHWVAPYKTNFERVSVSGNLKFKEMFGGPF
jgi:hypothetical protein